MPSADDIRHQQDLLATYRQNLDHSLRQAAAFGGVDFAPPATAHGIRSARAAIQRIKGVLRGWGVVVDDLPDDEAALAPTPVAGRAPAGSPTFIFNAPVQAGAASFGGAQQIEHMEVTIGDTINISNVSGSILNIKSTLEQVTQTIGAMPGDATRKAELQQLIAELQAELARAPAAQQGEAEAVAELAREAVEKAAKDKPNKTSIQITAEGLKKAAETLAGVLPSVVTIAGKIATLITGMVP
jgi:hypothetical protein